MTCVPNRELLWVLVAGANLREGNPLLDMVKKLSTSPMVGNEESGKDNGLNQDSHNKSVDSAYSWVEDSFE